VKYVFCRIGICILQNRKSPGRPLRGGRAPPSGDDRVDHLVFRDIRAPVPAQIGNPLSIAEIGEYRLISTLIGTSAFVFLIILFFLAQIPSDEYLAIEAVLFKFG